MTILLVSIHVEKTPPAFPLAASILKTTLALDDRTAGFDVQLKDYYLPIDEASIADDILRKNADACGFSASTWNAAEILKISREIKQRNNSIRLFAGGPQASAEPEVFSETKLFDFIICGEGEDLIADALINTDSSCRVLRSAPVNFSESKSPYPAVINSLKKYDGILWEVSRGCPYNCSFCYEARGCKTIRTIPDTRIIKELQLFRKKNIEKIWVLDPTFNHNRKHAEKVLELILSNHPYAHYTFEIRAELMTENLCKLLSPLHASLQIGLQTTNPAALEKINRSLSAQKFLDKCRMMSDYGLTFGIDLIYGLPEDNYEKFKESLDFAVSASPNNLDIFPLSVLPGTELADTAESYGIKHKGFPSYETIKTRSFSEADMERARSLTLSVDKLYNNEQAFVWFNTAAAALSLTPAALFEHFKTHRKNDALDFIKAEFRRQHKTKELSVIESFVKWSRAAEQAFASPGKNISIDLCRKPEVLDELASTDISKFLKRHPEDKMHRYTILFDGEELYIN